MNTDQLIASLCEDVPAVPRGGLGRRIATGLAAGALVSMLLVIATLGVRHDLMLAMRGPAFWMKTLYTLSLAIVAILAVVRLARPAGALGAMRWLMLAPVLLLAGIGFGELADRPSREWLAMWLGESWKLCPWLVVTLAMPIFAGLLWSFRRAAPTRLREAGAVAGLAAGACAATIYCLHCPEVSAIFVLTWYSLGMLLAAGVGALIGPRLMRW